MPTGRFVFTSTAPSSTVGYPLYVADWRQTGPFNASVACVTASSSTAVFNVEHSLDYTGSSAFLSSAATWFLSSGVNQNSCNAYTAYSYPVAAIRLNVTSGTSQATVTMTVLQSG